MKIKKIIIIIKNKNTFVDFKDSHSIIMMFVIWAVLSIWWKNFDNKKAVLIIIISLSPLKW
jgi:hypothetical protein